MTDDRLISLNAAKDYIDSQKGRPFIGCTMGEAMKIMLDEVPPVQPGWIPCSKKLPEPNLSVLVQLNDTFVDQIQIMTLNISKCDGDFFCFWETQEMGIDFEMDDVVAWMPLPKQWEGEDHEID